MKKRTKPRGLPKAGGRATTTYPDGIKRSATVLKVEQRELVYTPDNPLAYWVVTVDEVCCETCQHIIISQGARLEATWFQ